MGMTGGESLLHSSLASKKMKRKSPKTDFKQSPLLTTQSVVHSLPNNFNFKKSKSYRK